MIYITDKPKQDHPFSFLLTYTNH